MALATAAQSWGICEAALPKAPRPVAPGQQRHAGGADQTNHGASVNAAMPAIDSQPLNRQAARVPTTNGRVT
jgi:hypothetical protein